MEGQISAQFDLFRDILSFMERQRARPPVTSSAVSSSAPVQSSRRLIYTAALSGLPYSAVNPPVPSSLPAPVSGSRGVQGHQGRPLFRENTSRCLLSSSLLGYGTSRPSHEGDRSWGSPSWGSFGEGVPTAVGGQDFLGPYQ